ALRMELRLHVRTRRAAVPRRLRRDVPRVRRARRDDRGGERPRACHPRGARGEHADGDPGADGERTNADTWALEHQRYLSQGELVEPTRGRFTLLRFTLVLAVVTYLDRLAISAAAPAIREELGLSLVQMGWVFSAFTFAYAAFELPSGWLGDVIGPRKVLARIVLWWSAFTMLTGATRGFASLVTARFLFGVGEAGA